jgi:hypothetical protein
MLTILQNKMSHSDIIWIVGTLTFASIFGPYVAIKLIKQYTRPPINTLQSSGDIELMDYIEPVRPQQTYNHQDLFEPVFPIYERISVNYWRVPSYRSETLPSYYTDDRIIINSCLENEIISNSDFLIWIISLLIISLFLILLKSKL